MNMRTLASRAIGLAIRTTTAATLAAAAVTTSAAAEAGGNAGHEFCVIGSVSVLLACPSTVNPTLAASDGFTPIHMTNQKIGSPVADYWQAQAATSEVAAMPTDQSTEQALIESGRR